MRRRRATLSHVPSPLHRLRGERHLAGIVHTVLQRTGARVWLRCQHQQGRGNSQAKGTPLTSAIKEMPSL